MWIVPKTLYHFVPDTEGLNLDLEEQAWMFSQSVTWRTKHSVKQTWLRRWKRERWVQHLFGRTLKPSTQNHFVEKWTESLEATHANHSVVQGNGKGRKTQDTSGPTSENTSDQLNLFGASLKTSKDTLPLGCVTSSKTWSDWVTERRSAYSQRRKLARLTNGNESTSLQNYPTPAARDYKGTNSEDHVLHKSKGFKGHMNQLPNFIKYSNWPTPCAMEDKYRIKGNTQASRTLTAMARRGELNWPTPRTGGGSRPNGKGGKVLNEEVQIEEGIRQRGKKLDGPPAQEKSNTSGKNQESWMTPQEDDASNINPSPKRRITLVKQTGRLNPNWVEQLQGLEVGWTQISTEWIDSDCLAMESSPKPQN